MEIIWQHNYWYDFLRRYVDCCTRTGFSSVEIEGKDKLPVDGPFILAPNHCAALMDALLVLLTRKDEIAFGARSDIFKNQRVASILRWLRILPLARERDGLQEVAKNFGTIDEIVDCLGHGVPFGMFSEGTHRAQRGMMPVKKGVFRICKVAAERLGKPVYVVPVGLGYESFYHQVSRVKIRIGDPIDVAAYFAGHTDRSDSEIYRELCSDLRKRDLELIANFGEHRPGHPFFRAAGAIVSLPVFLVCAIGSLPIWLFAEIILMTMKDKAWTHTVYFCVRLFLPVLWPFFSGYGLLLNLYRNLWNDLRTRGKEFSN